MKINQLHSFGSDRIALEICSRLWLILTTARLIRTKATTSTISPMSAALYIATPNSSTHGVDPVTFIPPAQFNQPIIIAQLRFAA
jgi:hypothetical protein